MLGRPAGENPSCGKVSAGATALCVALCGTACGSLGVASSANAQHLPTVELGAYESTVGESDRGIAAVAIALGRSKGHGRHLFVRGMWWDTPHAAGALLLSYSQRSERHRLLFVQLGAGAVGTRNSAGRFGVRPAPGLEVGFAFDLARSLQLRVSAGQVHDLRRPYRNLGVSLCACSAGN